MSQFTSIGELKLLPRKFLKRDRGGARSSILARTVLAVVFAIAAIAKASAFSQFQASLLVSRLVPVNLTGFVGAFVICVEVGICIGLFMPRFRQYATFVSMVTVCFFISYSLWRWIGKIPVPCTCFGALLKMEPYQSIALNVCLLGLILFLMRGEADVVRTSRTNAGNSPIPV